ncbi:YraN family protein [Francisella sp. Scap27]|uniref:YraN family protein n=1 Tax=Francisella sp. Scap27 TaxID=2589986 RepID=UPI0015BD2023|nr:YraN family protein [Francisella sp. Scap27]QLE79108.1 YraN family protein [Francisella sp. Scap27]
MNKTQIGSKAESQACDFLKYHGIEILEQNFKALPYGEIDIIALDQNVLIFVEVKFRKSNVFGFAQEMVTLAKQSKIINTANIFLQQNDLYQDIECRFDVVAINNNDINWVKNAFQVN